MSRRLVPVLLVLLLLAAPPVRAGEDDCGMLPGWFAEIDLRTAEALTDLVSDDAWATDYQRAVQAVADSPLGVFELGDGIDPVVRLFAVPGEVLASFDSTEVPAVAADLHAVSMEYQALALDLLRTLATEDFAETMTNVSPEIDIVRETTVAAEEDLAARCPDEIGKARSAARASITAGALFRTDSLPELDQLTAEGTVGIAHDVLFAASPAEGSLAGTPVATPPGSPAATPDNALGG